MTLRNKYQHAIEVAKGFRVQGSADELDGKLYFRGTVGSQEEASKIWDAIETVPDWRNDIVGDIDVAPQAAGADAAQTTYTVRSGDTLRNIAQQQLGNANAYMVIFEANRDRLSDPDTITPGQVLKIPAAR